MIALIVVMAVTLGLGFGVWFADRHRHYGVLRLPALSLGTGLLAWTVLQFTGLGYHPELHWLSWLLPLLAACTATMSAAWWFGRHRESEYRRALRHITER